MFHKWVSLLHLEWEDGYACVYAHIIQMIITTKSKIPQMKK